MRGRARRLATLATSGALLLLGGLGTTGVAAAAATGPVHLTTSFDRDATLGSATALTVDLRVDDQPAAPSQPTQVQFEYPGSLGIVSSGLGLATCTRSPADFASVLIEGTGLGGCPRNAVMGYGTARAIVRLTNGQAIPEYASVTLLSGPIEHGRLGLVVYIDGDRPFGAKLAFAGVASGASPPYGGALGVSLPTIPGIDDLAVVSLVELRIVIGSHAIRYVERRHGRTVTYRPDGVQLPTRCPRGGFRFRARVAFANGTQGTAETTAPCPRRHVAGRPSR